MLTAYFDESGIHDGDHLCVVAGYVGNDAQWHAFAKGWITALGSRKSLHMRKIRNFRRAAQLLAKLGPLPEQYHLQKIVGGVWWKDYKGILKGRIPKRFTDPYMLAVQACLFQTMGYLDRTDQIAFCLSRQDVHERVIAELDNYVFKQQRVDSRVKDIHFLSPHATVCFEPADYLAFEVREYKSHEDSEKARIGFSILGDGKAVGYIYTPERLHERYPDLPIKHFPKSGLFNILEGN